MLRKGLAVVCLLALVFVGSSAAKESKIELQAGITLTQDSHYAKGLAEFGRLVNEYSNGTITLTVHPNSLLGGERDLIESVAMGTVAMALISTGPIPNFFPDFAVLDLPYLFPNAATAYKALDGEVGTELLGQMTAKGIIGLGFWENGIRHVTNNVREIKTPEDLKGLKVRTMENDIHMNTYRHYGASPTPMAMGEVFMALQQGVVDGQENPAINILTSRLNEVQKFMSLTGNFYSPSVLMLSKTIFDSMSEAQQKAVLRAAEEAKHWQRKYSQDNTAKAIADIKAGGTLVTEVDVNVWIAGSQNTYKDYEAKVRQDMIKKIRELR